MARFPSRSPRRRRRTGVLLGRALSLTVFLPLASRAPMYARLVFALLRDERVPGRQKALLAFAGGYLLLGRDLIPDSFPIIGGLDDLIVVVLAVELFIDNIPDDLLHQKLDELGIDPGAFDRDVDQIRRLTPPPIRRVIHEVPHLVDPVADLAVRSGIGPRLRSRLP